MSDWESNRGNSGFQGGARRYSTDSNASGAVGGYSRGPPGRGSYGGGDRGGRGSSFSANAQSFRPRNDYQAAGASAGSTSDRPTGNSYGFGGGNFNRERTNSGGSQSGRAEGGGGGYASRNYERGNQSGGSGSEKGDDRAPRSFSGDRAQGGGANDADDSDVCCDINVPRKFDKGTVLKFIANLKNRTETANMREMLAMHKYVQKAYEIYMEKELASSAVVAVLPSDEVVVETTNCTNSTNSGTALETIRQANDADNNYVSNINLNMNAADNDELLQTLRTPPMRSPSMRSPTMLDLLTIRETNDADVDAAAITIVTLLNTPPAVAAADANIVETTPINVSIINEQQQQPSTSSPPNNSFSSTFINLQNIMTPPLSNASDADNIAAARYSLRTSRNRRRPPTYRPDHLRFDDSTSTSHSTASRAVDYETTLPLIHLHPMVQPAPIIARDVQNFEQHMPTANFNIENELEVDQITTSNMLQSAPGVSTDINTVRDHAVLHNVDEFDQNVVIMPMVAASQQQLPNIASLDDEVHRNTNEIEWASFSRVFLTSSTPEMQTRRTLAAEQTAGSIQSVKDPLQTIIEEDSHVRRTAVLKRPTRVFNVEETDEAEHAIVTRNEEIMTRTESYGRVCTTLVSTTGEPAAKTMRITTTTAQQQQVESVATAGTTLTTVQAESAERTRAVTAAAEPQIQVASAVTAAAEPQIQVANVETSDLTLHRDWFSDLRDRMPVDYAMSTSLDTYNNRQRQQRQQRRRRRLRRPANIISTPETTTPVVSPLEVLMDTLRISGGETVTAENFVVDNINDVEVIMDGTDEWQRMMYEYRRSVANSTNFFYTYNPELILSVPTDVLQIKIDLLRQVVMNRQVNLHNFLRTQTSDIREIAMRFVQELHAAEIITLQDDGIFCLN